MGSLKRLLEVEDMPPHYWGMVGKWKEQVARVKGYPVEIKALVLERHSAMNVRERKLRSLSLGKW